jgi:octaprenyl-diphosphate synthase
MKAALSQHEIFGLVASDLDRVEQELISYATSPIAPIADIGSHLLDAGGKRVRPALLLLTARALGEVTPAAIRLGAVVELIHNATLVHDDVIDGADLRRGRPSANAHWGNPMTVLAGDWLYMQSFAVALGERNFDILSTLIGITQQMVEGELVQLTLLGKGDVTEEQLLDVAERKTASLFSGCMRLPAIAAGDQDELVERCAAIGRSLGMAFQLVDDSLDLTSTVKVLGKPVASDLREGKVTIPVHHALRNGSEAVHTRIHKVLEEGEFSSVAPEEIIDSVDIAEGIAYTRRLATRYASEALSMLGSLPPSAYRDAIIRIPEFILNREA